MILCSIKLFITHQLHYCTSSRSEINLRRIPTFKIYSSTVASVHSEIRLKQSSLWSLRINCEIFQSVQGWIPHVPRWLRKTKEEDSHHCAARSSGELHKGLHLLNTSQPWPATIVVPPINNLRGRGNSNHHTFASTISEILENMLFLLLTVSH